MHPRSAALTALAVLGPAFVGCGALVRPSDLQPQGHPLLDALSPISSPRPLRTETPPSPPPDAEARAKVRQNLDELLQSGKPQSDPALWTIAYAHTGFVPPATLAELRLAGEATTQPQVGDLVFFFPEGGVPGACPVRRKLSGGVLEVVCRARGAARAVRVDPKHPHTRRVGKRVVNTFLRVRRADDPPRAAYLAGSLVVEMRRVLP